MTNLLDLPEEILIIIIKHLDIRSIYNMYRSCGTLKNIILMQGVFRICNLSCNTLATQKSLKLDMIKCVSGQLYELNMRGVVNLTKSGLLPALRRMKCLKTLDVSFTDITIMDLLDIHATCSTIKNITINFENKLRMPHSLIESLAELFKNFINVHFVLHTICLNIALHILRKSLLDTLKLTFFCSKKSQDMFNKDDYCPFKQLSIFIENGIDPVGLCQVTWNYFVAPLKMQDIEYIFFEHKKCRYSVCVSPIFTNFFLENFKRTPIVNFCQNDYINSHVALLIWDKKTTTFDEHFFNMLKRTVKNILMYEISVPSKESLHLGSDIINYDWFYITQTGSYDSVRADTEPKLKKIRVGRIDQVLDYDEIFNEHKSINLSVYFPDAVSATLSPKNSYLSKITYLSLTGSYIRYSNEFFNVLFRSCSMLTTINVVALSLSPSCSSISRSLPLTQSLKNIRLVDRRIDFRTLFSSFTQCRTLENIWIIDNSSEKNELADLTALYQCKNLYSLRISAAVKKSTMTQITAMHKTLLKSCPEHFVKFHLETGDSSEDIIPYNPYMDVFNLDSIKRM